METEDGGSDQVRDPKKARLFNAMMQSASLPKEVAEKVEEAKEKRSSGHVPISVSHVGLCPPYTFSGKVCGGQWDLL